MGLFKPAWMSNDKSKALMAIMKINDEKILSRAAKEAPNPQTREAAISRVNDQETLVHIAKNDINDTLRKVAYDRYQAILYDIARNNENIQRQQAAARKITDQAMLASLAKSSEDYEIRTGVIYSLTDQEMLADVAKHAKDTEVRIRAVDNLIDKVFAETILTEIVDKEDGYYGIEAAAKLTDQTLKQRILANKIKNYKYDVMYYKIVANNITDQESLADIAQNAINDNTRWQAATKLTDQILAQKIFDDIALTVKDAHVRMHAVNELISPDLLTQIARNDEDSKVRDLAQKRLKDPDLYGVCKGKHKWKYDRQIYYQNGDHEGIDNVYTCEICGKEDRREVVNRLM
ncbi:MAG: hypothetical protein FWF47_05055 [Clostridia bacterium]|nr:hypothetical protein [Clostridia bacterium]